MNKQDFLSTVRKARNAGAMVIALEVVGSAIYLNHDNGHESTRIYSGKNTQTEYAKHYNWLFDWHMSNQIYNIPLTEKELAAIVVATENVNIEIDKLNFIHTRYDIQNMDDLIEYLLDMKAIRDKGIIKSSIHCNMNMKPGLQNIKVEKGIIYANESRIEFINVQTFPNPKIIEMNVVDYSRSGDDYLTIKKIQGMQYKLVKCSYCGDIHPAGTTHCLTCAESRVKYAVKNNLTLSNMLTGKQLTQTALSTDELNQIDADLNAARVKLMNDKKVEVLNDLKNSIKELQIQEKIITDFTESEFYQSAEDLQYYYHNKKIQVTKDSNLALYCESVGIDYNIINK